ncbi:hypothetical protein SH528x_003125 [Novipirellula sp. SH528]|uniref:hypothetical protein n=1 Tax=Novipirellula sp. SH528 TaxID=3454466 RepID=UPI003F9F5061
MSSDIPRRVLNVNFDACTAFRKLLEFLADFAMAPTTRHEQIRSLFNQAVDMVDTERRWFLGSIEDRDLAADVERLLESSACCGSFRDKNKDSGSNSC